MYKVLAYEDEKAAQKAARDARRRGYSALVRFSRPVQCWVAVVGRDKSELQGYLHNSGDKRRAKFARAAKKNPNNDV